jgi:hypothetical protein
MGRKGWIPQRGMLPFSNITKNNNMRHKQLVQDKLDGLSNQLRQLDYLYSRASSPYEKKEIYDNIQEIVDQIRTLINTED